MSSTDKYGERRFLFKDARGDLFSKVYFKDPFENPINPHANDISNTVEYDMMTSRFNIKKEATMQNDDIHYEFVDLIVRAALLHRKLDMSSEIGTRLNSARNAVRIYSKLLVVGESEGIKLKGGFVYDIAVGTIKTVGSAILKEVAAYLNNPVEAHKNITTLSQSFAQKMVNGTDIVLHSDDPTVEYTLGEVLDLLNKANPSVQIKEQVQLGLVGAIKEFIEKLYSHIDQHKLNIAGSDINETFNFFNKKEQKENWALELENTVMNIIKINTTKHFPNQYTKLSDPIAEEFWKNVYLKWNTLHPHTTRLYEKVISLRKLKSSFNFNTLGLSDDGFIDVPESDYMKKLSSIELSQHRLNLKKANVSKNITQFEHLLPLVPVGVSGLWYTDHTGQPKKFTQAFSSLSPKTRENALKIIYHGVYSARVYPSDTFIKVNLGASEMHLPATLEASPELPYIHYDVDKLTRRRLYVASKSITSYEQVPTQPTDSAQYIDLDYQHIWTRNADGKLTKTLDGVEVVYGEMDKATEQALRASSNCFTTQIKLNDKKQDKECVRYIHKCLLEDDAAGLDECFNDFLKHDNFFTAVENEIKHMHPLIALRTLQKFGFHAVIKYDDKAHMQLKKIQSVDDWLNGFMAKRFSASEMQKVFTGDIKNKQLLEYLKLVVNHVNRNPFILNKDFKGTTVEMRVPVKTQPPPASSLAVDLARWRINQDLASTKPSFDERNGIIEGPFGMVYSQDYGLIPPFLLTWPRTDYYGFFPGLGEHNSTSFANNKYMDFSQFQEKLDSGYFLGAKFFGDIIRYHLNALKESGKEIIQKDKDRIEKMLTKQLKIESELIKTIKYYEEYRKLVDYFHDYVSETLDEANIVKLVKNKKKLLTKKSIGERTLVELLAAIDSIDRNANDGSYTPLSADV